MPSRAATKARLSNLKKVISITRVYKSQLNRVGGFASLRIRAGKVMNVRGGRITQPDFRVIQPSSLRESYMQLQRIALFVNVGDRAYLCFLDLLSGLRNHTDSRPSIAQHSSSLMQAVVNITQLPYCPVTQRSECSESMHSVVSRSQPTRQRFGSDASRS